jgi:hypothetical protein
VNRLVRLALGAALLVFVHFVLARALAGGSVVAAMLAPTGAHSWATSLMAVSFLCLRLCLVVGLPAWLGAEAGLRLFDAAAARRNRPARGR